MRHFDGMISAMFRFYLAHSQRLRHGKHKSGTMWRISIVNLCITENDPEKTQKKWRENVLIEI